MNAINELAAALAKAQGAMKNAPMNKINPHFRNKYADLASIRDATIPALSANGLSITQTTILRDATLLLITRLMHQSGQFIESEYPLPAAYDKPQVMGSAATYGKRYSWAAICGIAGDVEDDDAEGAEQRPNANAAAKAKEHGEARGPLGMTELKVKLGEFARDLEACEDAGMLHGLLNASGSILDQCKRDLPGWWNTKPLSDVMGFDDRIRDKMQELAKAERGVM